MDKIFIAMKRTILLTFICTVLICYESAYGQGICKVLVPELEGTYSGDCKSGLADGAGEAIGVDYYKGEFSKGLPDGEGTYLWKNGATYTGEWKKGKRHGSGRYEYRTREQDSVLAGEWRNDKFIGARQLRPYVIEYRTGIGRVSCMRIGDRPYVKYKFSRGGGDSYSLISNLLMQSNSGSEKIANDFTGYENVTYPFSARMTFNAPNAFYTASIFCELRLTINEPGAWLVSISF